MPAPAHPLRGIAMELIANYPDWSAERIRDFMSSELQQKGASEELIGKLPSPRAISRWKHDAAGTDLSDYQYVQWPETFEARSLPPESSGLVLSLQGELLRGGRQLTVGAARWYLRCLHATAVPEQAAGQGGEPSVNKLAWVLGSLLATMETAATLSPLVLRRVQWWIALHAWRDHAGYRSALENAFPEGHPEREPWEFRSEEMLTATFDADFDAARIESASAEEGATDAR